MAKRTKDLPNEKRKPKNKIRVALIGVGNVASVLVQALASPQLVGLWHPKVGGYSTRDMEIVSAFDIDRNKVGKDLADAIFLPPNVSPKLQEVRRTGIIVKDGLVGSDVPRHMASLVEGGTTQIREELRASGADIVLNLIPSGMQETSALYCKEALAAGCNFINATPAHLSADSKFARSYAKAKLILAGDDLMSQFGGTAFHKGILEFINSRGLKVDKSYQLDVGGGTETLNTITEEVKAAKREIKSEAIAVEIPYKFDTVAGTTDYVDYMGNNRTSYFWISATSFLGSATKIDVYLRTNDGTNAANVLFDVIRAVRRSAELHVYGAPKEICDYGFKKVLRPTLLRQAAEAFQDKFID